MTALNLEGDISQIFRKKTLFGFRALAQNWKLPTPLVIFLDFWVKISEVWEATGKKQGKTVWNQSVMSKIRLKIEAKAGILAEKNFKTKGNQLMRNSHTPEILRIAHPANYSYLPPCIMSPSSILTSLMS